ncbi:uncharacterized protein LOC106084901 [Stomoxys calcitrans]|uniref:uncharacterized protein LOC106084901 n=1 Tax=Stomoxys calcitrans TaxID=35570 RepID=UPI0027E36B18|nr:uncharacterized protein LOC106084901 [Stomoxys calcitrans]
MALRAHHACYVDESKEHETTSQAEEEEKEADSTLLSMAKIEQTLEKKIKEGEYKLIETPRVRSPLWQLFSKFSKSNGSTVDGWIYCKQCKHVLKFYSSCTTNLRRHTCWKNNFLHREKSSKSWCQIGGGSKQRRKGQVFSQNYEVQNFHKTVVEKIENGLYKLHKNQEESGNPLWNKFAFVFQDNQTILNGWVYCCQCGSMVKYLSCEDVKNLRQHKCKNAQDSSEEREDSETQNSDTDLRNETEGQIVRKLQEGVYKLKIMNGRLKNQQLLKVFAFVTKANGIMLGYYCCLKCSKLYKFTEKKKVMENHECFQEYLEEKRRNLEKIREARSKLPKTSSTTSNVQQPLLYVVDEVENSTEDIIDDSQIPVINAVDEEYETDYRTIEIDPYSICPNGDTSDEDEDIFYI